MCYSALNRPDKVVADLKMAALVLEQNLVPESITTECASLLADSGNKKRARELVKEEKARLQKLIEALDTMEKELAR